MPEKKKKKRKRTYRLVIVSDVPSDGTKYLKFTKARLNFLKSILTIIVLVVLSYLLLCAYERTTIVTRESNLQAKIQNAAQENEKLKKDNEILRQLNRNLEKILENRNIETAKLNEKHTAEMKSSQNKFDDCFNDYKEYYRLYNEAREMIKLAEQQYREQRQIDHLEHMELLAWRKTEKARQDNARKLRSRIRKIRRQAKTNRLLSARNNFMATTETERQCHIVPQPDEIPTAVIALSEYLEPNNSTEEIQAYLWDCRSVESLIRDIQDGIVRAAFGIDWEENILAGLVGLHIIPPSLLATLIPKCFEI